MNSPVEPAFFYVSAVFYLSAMAFGMVIGSFLNVVIYRLPAGRSIVTPGSACPACGQPVAPYDNVPVFSYLWLRGRCRQCKVRISPRYPTVEFSTGLVFLALAWRFGPTWSALLLMIFAAGLIVAAGVDIDHQIIPDEISLGGLALGLVAMPLAMVADGIAYKTALIDSVLGALVGGGALWSVAFLHARISVVTGREFAHWPGEGEANPKPSEADYWLWFPGLGLGDVKLLAMIGAFVGVLGVLDTILLASVLGLVMGVVLALVTRSWNAPFGFGPAIAAGALCSLFLPEHLVFLLH